MERIAKVILVVGAMLVFGVLMCGLALFVVSGGEPVDFLSTAIIRMRLSMREDDLNRAMGSADTPIRFTITSGQDARAIAANLAAQSLISESNLFVDYVRANDIDVELEAGVYFLNQTQTIPQIAVALTDSRSSQFPFRILEGWRLEEIAAVIDDSPYFGFTGADFLRAVGPGGTFDPGFVGLMGIPSGASLEGFLFPDTYQLPATVTPDMLRDILIRHFLEKVDTNQIQAAGRQQLTMFQIVTLASIIERESVHSDENPRIASVYRNRLRDGMKLDADPTVQYGIGFQDGTWWPQITQDDYTTAVSPYNTYLMNGLPPGPIANPGLSAILAAIAPETTPYYYFRAKCDGSGYHNFATTLEEQFANAC